MINLKDVLNDGFLFQVMVQCHYFNKYTQKGLLFEDFLHISHYEIRYIYDFLDSLLLIRDFAKSQRKVLFHFMKKNNYAVDSLLYDGVTKTIIFFQITINENHAIHYSSIIGFINNDYQMKIDDKKKKIIKYFDFFKALNSELSKQFIFQFFMTKEKISKIEEKTKEKQVKLKDRRLFFILFSSDQLNKEISS